jgi:hypothetical protein
MPRRNIKSYTRIKLYCYYNAAQTRSSKRALQQSVFCDGFLFHLILRSMRYINLSHSFSLFIPLYKRGRVCGPRWSLVWPPFLSAQKNRIINHHVRYYVRDGPRDMGRGGQPTQCFFSHYSFIVAHSFILDMISTKCRTIFILIVTRITSTTGITIWKYFTRASSKEVFL